MRSNTDQDACLVCGNLCKTRCSRCKSARYCSGVCQIKHWRAGHRYVCVDKKNTEDQEIRPDHETSKFKLLSKHEMGEMAHQQSKQRVRYLEDELVKSKNEIVLLQSERDNGKMKTEFVSKRLHSFMKKSDQDQTECDTVKTELQTEREHVQRLTLELEETIHNAIIKIEEARVAEMRKQEKCIRMLMSELAKVRRNIQDDRKHDETKQIARKKVEEIGRDLANARNDLASAIFRAEVAEAKLYDLEEKIKLGNEKHFCSICLNNEKDMAFSCGHMTCKDCGSKMSICPICREQITIRIRLFTG